MTEARDELCNHWMRRQRTHCGRLPGHEGEHRTTEAMTERRVRITARRPRTRIKTDPAVRRKWNRKYRLSRYGITQKDVDWLLEIQDYACAMCHAAFSEDTPVYIDHDHSTCHPQEKRACRNCLRGLLCRDCNTALGHIERKLHLARVYLAALPGRLLPAA